MAVPSAPYPYSLDSPPIYLPDDQPPQYVADDHAIATDNVLPARMEEERNLTVETGLPVAESRTRRVCKMMCVSTSSALMVIAWAAASALFSGIGFYWVWIALPLIHYWNFLNVSFFPMSAVLVIALLLSPVFAVLGDVRFGNFRLMLSAVIPLNVSGLVLIVALLIAFAGTSQSWLVYILVVGYLLVFFAGAMFQANAIQLGRDVVGDSDSAQRGALVHWYYWAVNIPAAVFALVFYPQSDIISLTLSYILSSMMLLAFIAILLFLLVTCVVHCVFLKLRGWSTMLPLVKGNPFKQVFRVTRYALQTPANHGQFGFFARLNNSRQRNGGQSDDEEVDNVAKFWRLVLLILSLSGFFFWDDMWAVSYANILSYDATNTDGFLNSQATTALVVFICVPIYQLAIRPFLGKYSPPCLWRILVGLILQLISLSLVAWSVAVAEANLGTQLLTDACLYYNDPSDSYGGKVELFHSIIPQVINGFSQLLVFPAVIELILTDAPRVMQGLLISIWYAMQSIHVIVSIIETAACIVYHWPYYMVKIALVLSSTIAFVIIAILYKRHQASYIVRTAQDQSDVGVYRPLSEISSA